MKRFQYPLEPVRLRTQWALEASAIKLAGIDRSINQTRQVLAQLNESLTQAGQQGAAIADPHGHHRRLEQMIQLHARIDEHTVALAGLEQAAGDLRRACLEQQRRLEAVDAHCDQSRREFGRQVHASETRQADQEWLARTAFEKAPRHGS